MTNPFKVGDQVRCVDASGSKKCLVEGQVYTVTSIDPNGIVVDGGGYYWSVCRFEPAEGLSFKLPDTHAARKATPIATGVLDYFPLALAEVARVSKAGNDQHNPGQPLHWDRTKSTDHADSLVRHLLDRGTMDTDGQRHTAKVAWRALALLQTELENAK